jgi:hypothetical protein
LADFRQDIIFQEIADLEAKMREIRGIEKTDNEVPEDLD